MILQPASIDELVERLRHAHASRERVAAWDLRALDRIVEHAPEDMTVTVESGITLAALQGQLAHRRQWLPIDPPHADQTTIGSILAANASGPRRFGFGTVREHLIGIKVALADGTLIKAGGKVVKNVAGYDLCKLFIGSRGTLGVIVEATFKLRPLPEAEQFVQARCESLSQASALVQQVLASDLTPVVVDWHNLKHPEPPPCIETDRGIDVRPLTRPAGTLSPSEGERAGVRGIPSDSRPFPAAEVLSLALPDVVRSPALSVVVGFAGTQREVEAQVTQARMLGLNTPAGLEHETAFWASTKWDHCHHLSVLPEKLADRLGGLGDVAFIARAANGVAYYHGGEPSPKAEQPRHLWQRVKDAYDPRHILPDLPL